MRRFPKILSDWLKTISYPLKKNKKRLAIYGYFLYHPSRIARKESNNGIYHY